MNLTKLNYVNEAENVIKLIIEREKNRKQREKTGIITTSKIRNLLSMISEIYHDAMHSKEKQLSDDILSRIQYLKMRFAYEAGRDKSVKEFVNMANIFHVIDEIGEEKENLIVFCHYMEALVAYRKFYVEKDD